MHIKIPGMRYPNQDHVLKAIIILVLTQAITADDIVSPGVIAPHCSSKCGNVTIPYPFGIEPGCYYTENPQRYSMMDITCDDTTNPPIPILGRNIPILGIALHEAEIRLKNSMSYNCYVENGSIGSKNSMNLQTFTISSTKNMFVATGCDTYAWFTGQRYGKPYYTGCMTRCDELDDVSDDDCNGVGCCEASIPDGVTNITTTVGTFYNHSYVYEFSPCSAGYPVAKDAFTFSEREVTREPEFYLGLAQNPVVFNWGIGSRNCSEAEKDGSCLCKNNTLCSDLNQGGYRCNCMTGFSGNPYLPQGCKDDDECAGANDCEKPEYCRDTDGSYFCECPKGYHGNATKTSPCISSAKTWFIPVSITAGIGGVIIISLIVGFIWHYRRGERRLRKLRKTNFGQNGGLILHQKVSRMDVLKIFTEKELQDATDNYNENNVIGRGGFGVVYKGIVPPNRQQVAIKRSLKVDPGQVEQFINEVLVLSQVNNRNVVKLLGCCLETEVPLLVYEFVSNGTLYDHLHDERKASRLIFHMRLRIASEIADVLSYLHTTISTPIIHRDMKSMNILLDENYTAKVADFGASKLVPLEQDQLATVVMGTRGYLDPEYMLTQELTQMSDVYSFGVVLVELLTKEKALCYKKPKAEQCLAMHFLLKMKEDRLFDIVDRNISNDGGDVVVQIKEVAMLAKWCLRMKGDERPTMKEVGMELERIKRMSRHHNNGGRSFGEDEIGGDHVIGIAINDDGNTLTGGVESDLYSVPSFVSPVGDGR